MSVKPEQNGGAAKLSKCKLDFYLAGFLACFMADRTKSVGVICGQDREAAPFVKHKIRVNDGKS